jgi:hypothetical protein
MAMTLNPQCPHSKAYETHPILRTSSGWLDRVNISDPFASVTGVSPKKMAMQSRTSVLQLPDARVGDFSSCGSTLDQGSGTV